MTKPDPILVDIIRGDTTLRDLFGNPCERCGKPQSEDDCKGNDAECIYGENDQPHKACAPWDPYCCRCGAAWAISQT